jgi:hypothetical protein
MDNSDEKSWQEQLLDLRNGGKTMEEKLQESRVMLEKIENKLAGVVTRGFTSQDLENHIPCNKKKNSHLHILVESELLSDLKKEAESKKLSLGELCRQKLRGDIQLDRIEGKIDKIAAP